MTTDQDQNHNAVKQESIQKKRQAAPAVCRIFGTLIFLIVIIALLPVTVPRFMGYEIFNVISGSMEPEIPIGSAVYVKYEDPVTLKEGDVIAFYSNDSVVLHRIVENKEIDGVLKTKGDANSGEDFGEVEYADVIGKEVRHFPFLGEIMMIWADITGKILTLCLLLCGFLLHVLAGRLGGRD